jgi:O-antigen/teichoic acid export membrane protein
MNRLLRSVGAILSGRVATTAIGVLFTPLLVRLLSQRQYGGYATLMAGFAVVSLVARVGLFDALRKTVAENATRESTQSELVSVGVCVSILYFAVVGGSALLLVRLVPDVSLRDSSPLLLLFVALLFTNLFSVIKGAFYGVQREHVTELLQTGQKAIFAVVALLLASIGFELAGVFAGYLLSFVVVTLVGILALRSRFRLRLPGVSKSRALVTDLFTYGGTQLIGGLAAMLLYKTDVLLVRYFRDATAAGVYNAAIVPAEYVWFVPAVLQMAFLQRTARLWAADDVSAIDDQIRTGVKYALLSLTLFGVGLYALAAPFLQVYFGAPYLPATRPLQILIVGTFFFGISRVVNPVFQATGWLKYTEANTVIVLAVNVSLNLLLIPRYGILGAAVATSSSYVLMFVGVLAIWWRSTFHIPRWRFFGKILLVQSAFAVLFTRLVSASGTDPVLSMIVFPIVGGVLFVGLNLATGIVDLGELRGLSERLLAR